MPIGERYIDRAIETVSGLNEFGFYPMNPLGFHMSRLLFQQQVFRVLPVMQQGHRLSFICNFKEKLDQNHGGSSDFVICYFVPFSISARML
jgi:hypothetical protein